MPLTAREIVEGIYGPRRTTIRPGRARRLVKERKAEGCSCGESRSPALDFHHRNPEAKSFSIADVTWNRIDLPTVEEFIVELDKCEVMCSNCHRCLHAERLAICAKNRIILSGANKPFSEGSG